MSNFSTRFTEREKERKEERRKVESERARRGKRERERERERVCVDSALFNHFSIKERERESELCNGAVTLQSFFQ